jgi:hypothetical protein
MEKKLGLIGFVKNHNEYVAIEIVDEDKLNTEFLFYVSYNQFKHNLGNVSFEYIILDKFKTPTNLQSNGWSLSLRLNTYVAWYPQVILKMYDRENLLVEFATPGRIHPLGLEDAINMFYKTSLFYNSNHYLLEIKVNAYEEEISALKTKIESLESELEKLRQKKTKSSTNKY